MKATHYFLQGMLFLIFAQIMVGVNIVCSKYLLTFIPVLTLLVIRFSLATIILLPLHWLTSARKFTLSYYFLQLESKDYGFIFAQALTAGALFNCLILLGLQYTDANVAGIITSALPATIAIASWVILGEKIGGKKAFCILFATLGLVVIACDKLRGNVVHNSFWGDLVVLLSLIPEATYYVLCKFHPNRLPVFLVSAFINGINALLLIPFALFFQRNFPVIDWKGWLILFISGLSSGLFYVLWYLGSRHVDGIMASLTTAVMPIATVFFAWLFLGEHLTLWQFAGMVFVLLSIAVCAKR